MMDDAELLRNYAENGSEDAFTVFVRKHINLVYSAAFRRVGRDPHLAEEVTQAVFTAVAKKARALQGHAVLSGWLHRCTQYAAVDALRRQQRHRSRETVLDSMKEEFASSPSPDRAELSGIIDSLLDRLNEKDRDAVVLRFFEGRSFAEVGRHLRLNEDAARMRVDRALERLRAFLARRGIASSTAVLAATLANQTIAVPSGLVRDTVASTVAANAASQLVTGGAMEWIGANKSWLAVAAVAMGLVWILPVRSPQPTQTSTPVTSEVMPLPVPNLGVEAMAAAGPSRSAGQTVPALPQDVAAIPDQASGAEVLAIMARVYATSETYFDSGVARVTSISSSGSPRVVEKPFSTAFQRPNRFRFEYTDESRRTKLRYIVWMDETEVRTWWTLNQPPEQIVPNLSLAIAGATGVSSSTAHLVPSLLLPDIIQGRRLAELNVTQRTANESIEGAECARLEVAPKSGDAMTLWIEKKTGLLRRTFQERSSASSRSETTITINGFVNGAIPEELLEFAAPPNG